MKIWVTRSTRLSTMKRRSPPRKPLGRSARFVPRQPLFPSITHPYAPHFSVPLLPNPQSPLRGLRGVSPPRPRSRLLSPSKRMTKSKHPDPVPSVLIVSVLISCFSWPAKYILPCALPLHLSDRYRRLYKLFPRNCILHIIHIVVAKGERRERSVEEPLECFPPRFVSILLDDVLWERRLERVIGSGTRIARTP